MIRQITRNKKTGEDSVWMWITKQITHLFLQIIEHSDICGDFKKKYGSVKVFRRKFYSHLTEREINIEQISIKIQIRFDN